ncbi:MAG TPA: GNAT family N-acetyltransferase [Gaiellaceae bacterium]
MSATAPTAVDPTDVILRDGSTLRLRQPLAEDADALVAFFSGLSEQSRYLRFHGFPAVGPQLVEGVLDPDWHARGALIGSLDGRIVAVANWVRLHDPRAAEVAFAVADEVQGHGIGTRLLEQLAARAAAVGVEEFVAEVVHGNAPMFRVFRDAGFAVTRAGEGGEIEIRLAIAPTNDYRDLVSSRDHTAVRASLEPFFTPRTVAVVGASKRRGSIGGELFRNIVAGDFTGSAYPVNRNADAVAGVHGYSSVSEIPERVELVVICVPGEQVLAAADEALQAGVRALVVISAGFSETGAEGAARQEQLLALVRERGARLLGPNCLGIASSQTHLNATFAPRSFPTGKIGFSSQSGALGLALLERAEATGLGITSFVSIGNKADISSNDLLEWWEDDDETELVLLYLESFGNPRAFSRIARRVARRKPVLALKGGSTGAGSRAAGSHTAALAGSDAAADALFREAGVIRASTLDELIDVATLLSAQPVPRGRRVALLTNAGGLGILAADACEAVGLELPAPGEETQAALAEVMPTEASAANPIDMLGSATAKTFAQALPPVLADPAFDAAIVLFVPAVGADEEEVGAAISEAAKGADKPVLCVFISAKGAPASLRSAADVPAFTYPEAAARALGRAAERGEWLRQPAGTVPDLDRDRDEGRAVVQETSATGDGWLDDGQTRRLLAAYGIPFVREIHAATPADAVSAARELGYPVVLKTAEPGAHKTEQGGVALDLGDDESVRAAAEQIGCPLLVQPFVRGGTELLAGAMQDPVFGPLVAFGPGGVLAELIGEARFRLAPLTDLEAKVLVTSGKAGRLVAGFRGAPPVDEQTLVDLVLRLALLADDLPEVAELDLNPVLALPSGCVAVDARVRIADPVPHRRAKSW